MKVRWGFALVLLVALVSPILPLRNTVAANAVVGTGSPGSCTEAAFANGLAIAHTGGGGTIQFNCGGAAMVRFSSEHLIQSGANIVIDGGGIVTLDGGSSTRLLRVTGGARLELKDITLQNGGASDGGAVYNEAGELDIDSATFLRNHAENDGGAIYNAPNLPLKIRNSHFLANDAVHWGGAIRNEGMLTATGSTFNENRAQQGGAIMGSTAASPGANTEILTDSEFAGNISTLDGGAVGTTGNLTIERSDFVQNFAGFSAGALFAFSLGFLSTAVDISDSSFIGNRVTFVGGAPPAYGGAIVLTKTEARILGTEVRDNWAEGAGGGIYAESARLRITNSIIEGNAAATQSGGGLVISGARALIERTSISDNSAADDGGGLYVVGLRASEEHPALDDFDMIESTVARNSGQDGAAIFFDGISGTTQNSTISGNTSYGTGGAIYITQSTYRFNFNTITDNDAAEGAALVLNRSALELSATIIADQQSGPDCHIRGRIFSHGYNLDSDASCTLDPRTGDIIRGNAALKPLANYGGPTLTHLPDLRSDVVDAMLERWLCPPVDQRGERRPYAVVCDIGSVELRH